MKATDQYPSRQKALAKGASTYESETAAFGNPLCQQNLECFGFMLRSFVTTMKPKHSLIHTINLVT